MFVFAFLWWSVCAWAAPVSEVYPTTSGDECVQLADPPHGRVVQPDRSVGANVTIECDQGYVYTEATWRTCSTTKVWSGAAGICREVLCAPLPPVDHGQVIHSDGTYLSTSVVTCDQGYLYDQPDPHRTCERHNFWSGETGQCQAVSCPELGDVSHGWLVSSGRGYLDYTVLHCDTEYELTGTSMARCGAEGTWSHRLGNCLPPDKSLDWLHVFWLVPVAVILVVLAFICYKRNITNRRDGADPDKIALLRIRDQRRIIHAYFTLREEMPIELANTTSPEYHIFEAAVKKHVTKRLDRDVDVTVTRVNQTNRNVFVDISASELEEKDVETAINEPIVSGEETIYHVQRGSVQFTDEIKNALAMEIFRNRHVTDQSLDKPIDFDREYVRLNWSSGIQEETTGETDRTDEDMEAECLTFREGKELVLIQGRAGIGKTTLVQRLMWRWANGDWATRFKALFLLNVRHLMTVNKDVDLPRLLSRYAVYTTGPATPTMDWLQTRESDIGIIIDGIDEIPNFRSFWEKEMKTAKPLSWCFQLLKRYLLPQSTLFVTSRPFKDLTLLAGAQQSQHDLSLKLVELIGLTEKAIEEYVDKNVREGRREFVKTTLKNNPNLKSVSRITFYCAALCELLSQADSVPADLDTYTRITAFILLKYIQRSQGENLSPEEQASALLSLSRLAHRGLVETDENGLHRLVFKEADFDFSDRDTAITKMRNTGLLTQTVRADPEAPSKTTVFIRFVHTSIQELLAMCELLKQNAECVQQTLATLCHSQQFDMALLFLYGLAFDAENETIKELSKAFGLTGQHRQQVRWVLESPQPQVSGSLQAMQMIYESQSEAIVKSVGGKVFNTEVDLATKLTVVDVKGLTFLLKRNPTVETVRMSHMELDTISLAEFVRFIKGNTTVKELSLTDNVDDGWMSQMMEAVEENKGLRTLQLPCSYIKNDCKGLDYIAIALWKNTTLTELLLKGLEVNSNGTQTLIAALKVNTTISIRISQVTCEQEQLDALKTFGGRFISDIEELNQQRSTLTL